MAMEREMRVTSRRDSRMSRPMYHIVKFKPWNTDHSDGARGCSHSYSYKETMSSNYQKNLVLQRASVCGRWVSDKRLGLASLRLEQTVQTLLARAALAAAAQTSAKSAARGSLARAAALLLRRRHDDLLRLGTSAVVSSAQSCRQVLRATDTAASGSELPVQRQRERVGAGIRAVGGEGRRGTVRRNSEEEQWEGEAHAPEEQTASAGAGRTHTTAGEDTAHTPGPWAGHTVAGGCRTCRQERSD